MPFVKIHVLEGRYDEARLDRVSNAIQQALRSELGTAPDELFEIFHILQPGRFRHTRSFLGLNYSDDLIWLELTLITGRLAKDKRLGLLKALNDRIVDAAQISPDDLLITFFETAEENISFGRGFAQRADNSKLYSRS
ncbi:MAG TPA: tautomerase family protein [Terriglobia bacterium]|nr:tautomerase family protein [Terriglobia bacterium]